MKHHLLLIMMILVMGIAVACEDENPEPRQQTNNQESIPWQRPNIEISPQNVVNIELAGSMSGHNATIYRIEQNENSQRVATIGADDRMVVWNMASGQTVLFTSEIQMSDVLFLDDNDSVLTVGDDEQLRKWSLQDNNLVTQTQGHEQTISAMAVSPDNTQVLIAGIDGIINIFDTESLNPQTDFIAHTGGNAIFAMYFSQDGNTMYSVSESGEIFGWDTTTWEQTVTLEDEFPAPLATIISSDAQLLAVARQEELTIYNLNTRTRLISFELPTMQSISKIEFSRDNTWIAIGSNLDSVVIHDVATGDAIVALRGHGRRFLTLAFSPDKDLLLTGLSGGDAYLWDLRLLLGDTGLRGEVQIPRAVLTQAPNLQLNDMLWSQDGKYIVLVGRQGDAYMLAIPE